MTTTGKQKHNLSMTIEEALRFLFTQNAEWIVVDTGQNAKFFNIRQIVAFLEKGMGSLALQEILDSMPIKNRKLDEADLQTTDGDARMVALDEEGTWIGTVRDYRKKRLGASWGYGQLRIEGADRSVLSQGRDLLRSPLTDPEIFRGLADSEEVKERLDLPKWWCAPVPLLYFDGKNVILNDCGEKFLRADKKVLAGYLREAGPVEGSYLFEMPSHNGGGRTIYSLRPLEEPIYHIEDVSGDYRTAQDLLWWASVGKTLVAQIEQSGASVRRALLPPEKHDESEQVFACAWDGDLQGYIVISVETPAEAEEILGEGAVKRDFQETSPRVLAGESEQPKHPEHPEQPLTPVETETPERVVSDIREEPSPLENKTPNARKTQKGRKGAPEKTPLGTLKESLKETDGEKEVKKETKKTRTVKAPKTPSIPKTSEVLSQTKKTVPASVPEAKKNSKRGKKSSSSVAPTEELKEHAPEESAQTLLPVLPVLSVAEDFRPASLRDALMRGAPPQQETPVSTEPVEVKLEEKEPSPNVPSPGQPVLSKTSPATSSAAPKRRVLKKKGV